MIILNSIAAASAAAGAIWLIVSSALVGGRLRGSIPGPVAPNAPSVALIRPVAGMEHRIESALRTSFELSYPSVEIFFCAEDDADPAVAVVRRLIAEHPLANARLLIGRERVGIGPKINNAAKAWNVTSADWLVIADANAVLPVDFIEGLMARWGKDRAVVSTPTLTIEPGNFAAEIEAAFVNLLHTRTSLAADLFGFEFVLGKTMLWRRDTMTKIGGLETLAAMFGDDIVARKAVIKAGMSARLGRPIPQRAGARTLRDVLDRQLRWLRVSRGATRGVYALQVLSANILPMFWVGVLVMTGVLPWLTLPAFILGWYAIECALAIAVGWPMSWRMPLALVIRDLLHIPLWAAGLRSKHVEWRGHVSDGPRPPNAIAPEH